MNQRSKTIWPRTRSDMALVLAAHGSSDDARCAAPVFRLASAMRDERRFGDVVSIFWKQARFFRDVYQLTAARRLIVVPVMMAGGYYAHRVLPRELRLDDPPAGRRVIVTEAIGERNQMAELILAEALDAASAAGIDHRSSHLLIVGHGTMRDPAASGGSTHRHAASIAGRALFRRVHAAFLEQDPHIRDAMRAIDDGEHDDGNRHPVIVVPFLVADGTHSLTDIRRACGVEAGSSVVCVRGRRIVFARAVGEQAGLSKLILAVTSEGAQRSNPINDELEAA